MTDDDSRAAAEDELRRALQAFPPLGRWVIEAACAGLGDVFAADTPPGGSALARICQHCPVYEECASYAASSPVRGFWAGTWRIARPRPAQAA